MSVDLTVYILTRDLERSRRFYELGLDIKSGSQEGNWIPFALNGATFALHAAGNEGNEDIQHPSFSFAVEDIEATVKRFEVQGARVLGGIREETFGRMATLEDPEGRSFEVVQY